MHQVYRSEKMVSVIIPAYNEVGTIGSIVETAISDPRVAEVIVVDDGSSDGTDRIAEQAGARVLKNSRNLGKAAAMDRGVSNATYDVIFFIDADLIGLTHECMNSAIQSVLKKESDMYALIADRGPWVPTFVLNRLPLLSGTRVMNKEVWHFVPPYFKNRFEIELALNFFARKNKKIIAWRVATGVTQVIKEKKRGVLWGLYQRMFMIRDIVFVISKLYIVYPLFIKNSSVRKLY